MSSTDPIVLTPAEPIAPGPAVAPRPLAHVWPLAVGAGLLAGLVAWWGGEATLDVVQPVRHAVNSKGMVLQIADRWDAMAAEARNAAIAFVILGGAVGACLGIAGGLAGHSLRRGLVAALLGLIVGAAGSAGLAAAVLSPYNAFRFRYPDEASRDLMLPLLVHGSIWSVAGLAGGLAFAIGAGVDRRLVAKVAVAGLVGTMVGTLIFELCGNLVFAGFDSNRLVAAVWTGRLAARMAVALGAAVAAALTVADRRNRRVPGPA